MRNCDERFLRPFAGRQHPSLLQYDTRVKRFVDETLLRDGVVLSNTGAERHIVCILNNNISIALECLGQSRSSVSWHDTSVRTLHCET